MIVGYKTVRSIRWVFANGEAVGKIEPMLTAAGKWAFIPIDGYGWERPALFKNILYGNTIGAVRTAISHQVRRLS
jgi:hypothetical protein